MISNKMKKLVENNSAIREMFEEGKRLEKKFGKENVFDFSLGNPSTITPSIVDDTIKKLVDTVNSKELHGYMSNSGFEDVRAKIADSINSKYGTNFNSHNLIMTAGAASGLNIVLKPILNPGEEIIVFAPYFMEYKNYIENYDGIVTEVMCNTDTFEPNINSFEQAINPNTRAVIINTPNNPTGVVYSEDTIKEISRILEKKEKEFNNQIFLISDEPYREIVYDNIQVPYVTKYYKDTFVVYSYSKSLSLPGERIGYVVIPSEMEDSENIINAITIANRIIGVVNAPALMQKVVGECASLTSDFSEYAQNREELYSKLIQIGYECIKPNGAFYLFLKSPIPDDKEFCKMAKDYNIIMVPGSSFSCPGYVRLAFCVKNETVKKALLKFEELFTKFN